MRLCRQVLSQLPDKREFGRWLVIIPRNNSDFCRFFPVTSQFLFDALWIVTKNWQIFWQFFLFPNCQKYDMLFLKKYAFLGQTHFDCKELKV